MDSMELKAVLGFSGTVPNGLVLHPGKKHLVYPLGDTIVLREVGAAQKQSFLKGHTDSVSCIAVSPSGKYIASGQQTHMGFQADVIIWDFETGEIKHRLSLHKVKVQALAFSPNEEFVASLGGEDDNTLVVWDIETGAAICGAPAANDQSFAMAFFNQDSYRLVTGGAYSLRIWVIDPSTRKLRPMDCKLGQTRRVVKSLLLNQEDDYMYVGTATGDLIEVRLDNGCLQRQSAPKDKLSRGIISLTETPGGEGVLAGAGDGSIRLVQKESMRPSRSTQLMGTCTSVTSMCGSICFAGTSESNIYAIDPSSLSANLVSTCHFGKINDVVYPYLYSEVFATASTQDIRVWNASTFTELLRIQVGNLDCHCITFSKDGKSIISGWSDGAIRAFGPQSGKLLYAVKDCHAGGVTAVACSNDCTKLVSGGANGQVRVWRIGRDSQVMVASMKEHKQKITSIALRSNDQEAVSASEDGSCIIWGMERFTRNTAFYATTFFKRVMFNDDESQLMTVGTDRKVAYWDAFDGTAIRLLTDEDTESELLALSISSDGTFFISAGGDKVLKLWDYDAGVCKAIGTGHAGSIQSCQIAPDMQQYVSVDDRGSICCWGGL